VATSIAAGVLICGVVMGCAPRESGESANDETGWVIPTQNPGETIAGARTDIEGVLRVESNGCFTLELPGGERRWVIWPEGTLQADSRVTFDEVSLSDGDGLVGVGALVTPDAIPGWADFDGYTHSLGEFCDAERLGVAALDSVALAVAH
jgi:hypothetical protein